MVDSYVRFLNKLTWLRAETKKTFPICQADFCQTMKIPLKALKGAHFCHGKKKSLENILPLCTHYVIIAKGMKGHNQCAH